MPRSPTVASGIAANNSLKNVKTNASQHAIERRQMTARPANLIALELPLLELGEVARKLFVRLKNVKTNASQHAIERRQMTDCTTGEPDRA